MKTITGAGTIVRTETYGYDGLLESHFKVETIA